jgi:dGTPase
MFAKHSQLKRFLGKNLYNHEKVQEMAEKSSHIIAVLFESFINNPNLLPDQSDSTILDGEAEDNDSIEFIVKDYIAGMTDRFAMQEYERIMTLTA